MHQIKSAYTFHQHHKGKGRGSVQVLFINLNKFKNDDLLYQVPIQDKN